MAFAVQDRLARGDQPHIPGVEGPHGIAGRLGAGEQAARRVERSLQRAAIGCGERSDPVLEQVMLTLLQVGKDRLSCVGQLDRTAAGIVASTARDPAALFEAPHDAAGIAGIEPEDLLQVDRDGRFARGDLVQ